MNYCVKHNELCDSADASGHCSLTACTACNRYLLITDEAPTSEAIPISFIKELIDLSRKVGADRHAESLEILLEDWEERKQG